MYNRKRLFLMPWHTKFLKAALVYNLVVFLVFFFVYQAMRFEDHFDSSAPVTARGKLYFAVMAHTSGGSNDIVPKTDFARLVVAAHVTLAWLQILLVFLS